MTIANRIRKLSGREGRRYSSKPASIFPHASGLVMSGRAWLEGASLLVVVKYIANLFLQHYVWMQPLVKNLLKLNFQGALCPGYHVISLSCDAFKEQSAGTVNTNCNFRSCSVYEKSRVSAKRWSGSLPRKQYRCALILKSAQEPLRLSSLGSERFDILLAQLSTLTLFSSRHF